MTLNSDDTPTGPIASARQAPPVPQPVPQTSPGPAPGPVPGPEVPAQLARRRNNFRDLSALVLLVLAPLFPWNLYFGLRIPGSSVLLWAVVALVTVLSLVSLAASRAQRDPRTAGVLRLSLNAPYLALLACFIVFDVFESIRFGGTVQVPGGIGPGGWLGAAGALLAAQPPLSSPNADEQRYHGWLRAARLIGYASMFGAALTAGFNLCWRVRYALRGVSGSEPFDTRNTTVLLSAVVYGVVALAAVLVASRWILRSTPASRFATFALGCSALFAGVIVWILPVGSEIDAFHGIAQNTSTAGVGYEGYLAWAAAAALFVPMTLFSPPEVRTDRDVWRNAIRKALTLILVWCVGSALMRVTDLFVAAILSYPTFPYDSITLAVFDMAAAALALWLRVKLAGGALRSRLINTLSALLVSLMVSRVILGVMLAPRFEQTPGTPVNPVYGNNLAQQITSTFDVTLCWFALSVFAAIIIAGRIRKPRRRRQRPGQPSMQRPAAPPRPQVPVPARPGNPPPPSEARTTQFRVPPRHDAPTSVLSTTSANAPRIFRSAETTGPVRPVFRPPRKPGER